MAYTTIKPVRLQKMDTPLTVAAANRFTTVTTEGGIFKSDRRDRGTVVEVDNTAGTSEVTITIKGNNKYSVCIDKVVTIAKASAGFIECNSEYYCQMEGEHVGKMIIVPSATVKIGVIQLA